VPKLVGLDTLMLDVVYSIGCLQDTFLFPHFGLTSVLGYSSSSFLHVCGMSCLVVIWLLPQTALSSELGECQCCDLCWEQANRALPCSKLFMYFCMLLHFLQMCTEVVPS
jgi:hypothetical protein